ncbi:hypothetical protein LOTGIDRAFT_112601 [Lottia gigantea]|uniref:Nucleoside diphosphate kinase n=1 Tax=Lottia gigantea TaxID=225164 RepID=V4ATN2_LOTGI|nr:hypothetical protein LOTGIDRAFT_112601 [Lottia gigantea]ESP00658.1 hypothetical protein LOTGIDRAFT_112601 [Lottia gigantea]
MSCSRLQLTLAILKPDVTARPHIVKEIKSMILRKKFYFVESKKMKLAQSEIETFYKEHEGKFFHNRLVNFMNSGSIWAHILAREDCIKEWRKLMGPTKVLKTVFEEPNSIRGKFGLTDTRNCTHGSDSEETAKREIKLFFPEFDEEKWRANDEDYFINKKVKFDRKLNVHVPMKDS